MRRFLIKDAQGMPAHYPLSLLPAEQKLRALTELARSNLVFRACLHRVASAVVPERVRIAERTGVQAPFRPLASDLASFLEKHMCVFLQSALESLLVAGFVVFVIRTHELRGKTLEVPVALPLGAFTWSVQPVGRDTKRRFVRDGALYYLEITPLHHDFSGRELHVYQVTEPVPDQDPMPSRVDGILAEFLALQSFEATIRRIDTWNSVKHITTSEAVNAPRDQTTDGITLLDEFRRYIMSGEQSGINQHYMVMSGNGAQREDPSNAASSWLENFSFAGSKGDSTCVHQLPPNTSVNELGPLELRHDRQEVYQRFERNVLGFFEMMPVEQLCGTHNAAVALELQIQSLRHLCTRCAALLEHAYAAAFGVDKDNVQISLPVPKLPAFLLAGGAEGGAEGGAKHGAKSGAKRARSAKTSAA